MLRADPPEDLDVLFAGSSTTLHGLDGELLRSELGIDGEVLNLGVQDLRVNQIKFLVEVFLEPVPERRACGHGLDPARLQELRQRRGQVLQA